MKDYSMQRFYILVDACLLMTIISKYIENFYPMYTEYGRSSLYNDAFPTMSILFWRFTHYVVVATCALYYLIFSSAYDYLYYFCCCIFAIYWYLKNGDCIFSLLERICYMDEIENTYETNKLILEDKYYRTYYRVFLRNYTLYGLKIVFFCLILNYALVLYRVDYKYKNILGIPILIYVLYVLFH